MRSITIFLVLCYLIAGNIAFAKPVIEEYDLKYSIDFKQQKLYCNAILSLTNIKQNDTLHLLLYRLLKIRSVKDNQNNNVSFQQQVVSFSDWEVLQVNAITIFFSKTNQPSQKITIKYEGYLLGYTETGMSYVKDNISTAFTLLRMDSYAYPVQGVPSWEENRSAGLSYFNYQVAVKIPDSLKVINGGKLISKNTDSGMVEYIYQNLKPAWRIDIAVSKYATLADKNFSIHYFPDDSAGAKRMANYVKKAFALFNDWFGNIESNNYSIIEIPDDWGSQTDVTCILQTASAFTNEDHIYELYHEISHIWNLVSIDKNPCRLESEGLAMFLQYLTMEKLQQRQGLLDSAAQKIFGKLKNKLSSDPIAASTSIAKYGEMNLTNLSYSKGMLFFYLLYKKAGEKNFMQTIKGYYEQYRKTGAGIDDFANYLIIKFPEKNIKAIVNDWIFTNKSSQKILNAGTVKSLIE